MSRRPIAWQCCTLEIPTFAHVHQREQKFLLRAVIATQQPRNLHISTTARWDCATQQHLHDTGIDQICICEPKTTLGTYEYFVVELR